MAVDPGWISGHTSSSDITVISILFLIVYIALYTLCTTCFNLTPESFEEKEEPSSLSLSVTQDHRSTHITTSNEDGSSTAHCDTPQVPAGPQHVNHTVVSSQKTNIYSHNRGKSDGYFSQEIPPRISDTPKFLVRSTGSVSSVLPALPPFPPVLYVSRVQVEPKMVPSSSFSSSSGHPPMTERTVLESVTPLPEDMNSVFSEEHLYECIDNVRVTGPSSARPIDKAEENWYESESPYSMVTEWTGSTATHDFATLTDSKKEEEIKFIFPPHPAVQDETSNPDRTVLYAAVNKKNKSRKSLEGEASVVGDNAALDEDEAPPVPDKIFN